MRRKRTIAKTSTLALSLAMFAFCLLCNVDGGAAVRPGAKYEGGNISLDARNATVSELLETIARTAGVDVFVAKGFLPNQERLSFQSVVEPLEDAVKRILRGYNYVAVYAKEGEDFRIVALKVYPAGQAGGEVIPLFTGGRQPAYEEKDRQGRTVTVLVDASGDMVTRGTTMARRGVVAPSQTEIAPATSPNVGTHAPWFALQMQQEQAEADRFADLLLLRQQVEKTDDPQRKKALALVYADEMTKYQAFKRSNVNKMESLKRMHSFQELQQHR